MDSANATYTDIDYDENVLYQGFAFERIIYSYIWVILVTVTCLFNLVVISILMRKSMRNTTYMILTAISISDSLTGLTTLPTYIAVFQDFSPIKYGDDEVAESNNFMFQPNLTEEEQDYFQRINKLAKTETIETEGYILSETQCDAFMISKFFLSKTFHTVSVWLTLFLAVQRFLVVKSPFKRFSEYSKKKTIIICVVIFMCAPILHIYHLFKDKSVDGICSWSVLTGRECAIDCIFLWSEFMLGHFLPSLMLVVFTWIFVCSLHKTNTLLRQVGNKRQKDNEAHLIRQEENRHVSIVVTAIVVVFLLAELPYAGFLLYVAIYAHMDIDMDFEFNRSIHATYEILLVLSFNANFYIYTFFNKRFRKILKETFISPVCCALCQKACAVDHRLPEIHQHSPKTYIFSMPLSESTTKSQPASSEESLALVD